MPIPTLSSGSSTYGLSTTRWPSYPVIGRGAASTFSTRCLAFAGRTEGCAAACVRDRPLFGDAVLVVLRAVAWQRRDVAASHGDGSACVERGLRRRLVRARFERRVIDVAALARPGHHPPRRTSDDHVEVRGGRRLGASAGWKTSRPSASRANTPSSASTWKCTWRFRLPKRCTKLTEPHWGPSTPSRRARAR